MSLMNLEWIKFFKMFEKWVNCLIIFILFYVIMFYCNIYNYFKNLKCGLFVKIIIFLLVDILLFYFNNKVCFYKDLFWYKRV